MRCRDIMTSYSLMMMAGDLAAQTMSAQSIAANGQTAPLAL